MIPKRIIEDLDPEEVSLVDNPAVNVPFLVQKNNPPTEKVDPEEEVKPEEDETEDPKPEVEEEAKIASLHAQLLQEELDVLIATANKIVELAGTGNPEDLSGLQSLIWEMDSLSWKMGNNASIVSLSKQAKDSLEAGETKTAATYFKGALELIVNSVQKQNSSLGELPQSFDKMSSTLDELMKVENLPEDVMTMASSIKSEMELAANSLSGFSSDKQEEPKEEEPSEEMPEDEEMMKAMEIVSGLLERAESDEAKAEIEQLKAVLENSTKKTEQPMEELQKVYSSLGVLFKEELPEKPKKETGEEEDEEVVKLRKQLAKQQKSISTLQVQVEKQSGSINPSNGLTTEGNHSGNPRKNTTWPSDMADLPEA